MKNYPLPRLDQNEGVKNRLLNYCRLKKGELWQDPTSGHKVGCLDATDSSDVRMLMGTEKAALAIQDPPYNLIAFQELPLESYVNWCKKWVQNTHDSLKNHAAFYVWMGADQTAGFQPLPDFMVMMRETLFRTRSFITMRNQRGYGTQKNWMAVRQELLYYMKGDPAFNIDAEYT
ncbi:MAG: DNA methyltransferase, partial [Patescibacteria group bacterium]